jgi:hypothetical protein
LPSKTAIAPVNPTFLPRVNQISGIHIFPKFCCPCLFRWMYT